MAAPLMEVRGIRSSWLTMARNSALSRSCSSTSVMSCMVTTTDSNSPSSERMGVAFNRTLMLRPSGTPMTISSARTVSVSPRTRARGNSCRENSPPSARRMVINSSRASGVWSGFRSPLTILRASRLEGHRRSPSGRRGRRRPPARCR